MQVSADQVASLRAFLEGDFEGHQRLNAQLDRSVSLGFSALLNAAFFQAADRRFPKGTKGSDVIDFVGDVRVRYEGLTDHLDPHVSERLIRSVRTGENLDDLETKAKTEAKFFLLYVLVADEQLDEAGLDSFLEEARQLADEWIAED